MITNENIGIIILAAGLSSRMGKAKAFLKFNDNFTFLEQIIDVYFNFGIKDIIVVLNSRDSKLTKNLNLKTTKIIVNQYPEKGRTYSLQLGGEFLLDKDYIFLQNIDNPFINSEILEKIYSEKDKNCYISPIFNSKGGHPILIPKNIFTKIHTEITENQNLKEILQPFCRKNVLMNSKTVLININTQNEYIKLKNLLK